MEGIMETKEILHHALSLKPADRFLLIENLITSLNEPDKKIDEIWANEAEKRLTAYREGRLNSVPMDEILSTDN